MKKKGLIISTIVMVVVLIAALTTSTYAWFNAAAAVKVDDITLSITSDAKVNVGVRTTGARASGDSSYGNYHYETLTSTATDNAVAWDLASATSGLGSVLSFGGLALGVNKAIGTASVAAGPVYTVDNDTFDWANATKAEPTKSIIKAPAGTSAGKPSDLVAGTAEIAAANKDFLHAIIGVEANKDNIKGMYVKVTVATTDSKSILGMNAALHFYIINAAGEKIDFQPFGAALYSSPKSAATATTASAAGGAVDYNSTNANQLTSVFYFWVGNDATADTGIYAQNGAEIVDFEIYACIEGADPDCNSNALGTSCTISIEFDGTSDITKLSDGTTAVSSVTFLTFA